MPDCPRPGPRASIPRSSPTASLLLVVVLCLAAQGTRAAADLCEGWATRAAREAGIPPAVLHAVALTETGRHRGGRFAPWPWSINLEGEGHWFDTRAEALAFARQALAAGRTSFDVGCFQINYRWHGARFASLEEMLEPAANARYAARFLSDLHEETGTWTAAAGAYHSRTERHARRYRARFREILAGLEGEDGPRPVARAPRHRPPPRKPAGGRLGSVVALEEGGGTTLFAPARGLGG